MRSSHSTPASDEPVKARGHFPTEQAEFKVPVPGQPLPRPPRYLKDRWAMRWKPALNARLAEHDRTATGLVDRHELQLVITTAAELVDRM
jgi:hypothetical protein